MRVRIANQVLADSIYVLSDNRVVHQFDLRFDLLGVHAATRNLAFDCIPVPHSAAATYVAIAHGVDVGLAAIVLDVAVVGRRKGGGRLLGRVLHVTGFRLIFVLVGNLRQCPGPRAERRDRCCDCQPPESHTVLLNPIIRPPGRHQAPILVLILTVRRSRKATGYPAEAGF